MKSFLDYHKIPSPQPRSRDSLLTAARQNYDAIAKKTNEYASYPGDWLYHSWSESDLKEFLDERGIPAPQPTTRDKLIASVRRNARLSSLNLSSSISSASKSAASATSNLAKSASSAQASLSDALFDSWSDSKLKEFLDEHGVPVPQGSKKNEMIALARKQRASLSGNIASTVSGSAASAYGAATSQAGNVYSQATDSAGNAYAQATDTASAAADKAFDLALGTWSESRLKAFLDSRGIPVPQGGKRDELLASARLNQHKASTGYSAWTFDTWTVENLQKYLESQGKKTKKGVKQSRNELVKQAQDQYASASKKGGSGFASVTNYLAKQTDAAKAEVFDTWSDSDLKDYLDSYGVTNYQGSNTNELRAEARKQYNYFKHGSSTPSGTIFAQIQNGIQWVLNLIAPAASSVSASASSVSATGSASASSAYSVASKSASSAASSASKEASSSSSSLKNEL